MRVFKELLADLSGALSSLVADGVLPAALEVTPVPAALNSVISDRVPVSGMLSPAQAASSDKAVPRAAARRPGLVPFAVLCGSGMTPPAYIFG